VQWLTSYFISFSSVHGGSEQKHEQRNGPGELHFLFKISEAEIKRVKKRKAKGKKLIQQHF